MGLRVKPSMNVGTQTIAFPNYIKLEKKTGTNTNTTTTNNNSGSHTLTPAGSLR